MKVIILRGPSGAGKSTYIEKTYRQNPIVCSADSFFLVPRDKASRPGLPVVRGGVCDYVYDFDPMKLAEAHNECMNRFLRAISQKMSLVVVDNTNIRLFEYVNYVKAANMMDYEVEIIEMVPETIEELKRVIARNVHRVPADVVVKMVLNFEPDPHGKKVPIQ